MLLIAYILMALATGIYGFGGDESTTSRKICLMYSGYFISVILYKLLG